jgi:DnaJ C terminal domain
VFVLQQKDHPKFKRKYDDLFVEHTLSLTEALCGFKFALTHLDGRQLLIRSNPGEVIKPGMHSIPLFLVTREIFSIIIMRSMQIGIVNRLDKYLFSTGSVSGYLLNIDMDSDNLTICSCIRLVRSISGFETIRI